MPNVKNWTANPIQPTEACPQRGLALVNAENNWQIGVNPPKVRLFSNNPVLGLGTVLIDLIECAFTGYAAIATNMVPLVDSNGNSFDGQTAGAAVVFTAGTIGTPDIAVGWYMTDEFMATLIAVEKFDTPYSFDQTGDLLNLYFRLYQIGLLPIGNPGT